MSSYTINFSDPTQAGLSLDPGKINGPGNSASDTSLRLHGAGTPVWGEAVNENFVRLLENFMGATAPVNPVMGQMWVDIQLYFRDTMAAAFYRYDIDPRSPTYQTWLLITVTSQPTAPTGTVGAYWFNTIDSTLNYFNSANDGVAASWMLRSFSEGTTTPTASPNYQIRIYDATVDEWGVISSVLISDSTNAPADNRIGSLRFAPTAGTLHVWTGSTWSTLITSGTGVFTGDLDMGTNLITNLGDAVNPTDALNMQSGDLRYVNVSGDTMAGNLILNADPGVALGAATKQYVDNTAVLLSGSSMSGFLTLNADPTASLHAVPKQYLDSHVPYSILALGNQSGTINLNFASSRNFSFTLTANSSLGVPSGVEVGQSGIIQVTQNGVGSKTLSYDPVWKFESGVPPVLSTAAGAIDVLVYMVLTPSTIMATFYGNLG